MHDDDEDAHTPSTQPFPHTPLSTTLPHTPFRTTSAPPSRTTFPTALCSPTCFPRLSPPWPSCLLNLSACSDFLLPFLLAQLFCSVFLLFLDHSVLFFFLFRIFQKFRELLRHRVKLYILFLLFVSVFSTWSRSTSSFTCLWSGLLTVTCWRLRARSFTRLRCCSRLRERRRVWC